MISPLDSGQVRHLMGVALAKRPATISSKRRQGKVSAPHDWAQGDGAIDAVCSKMGPSRATSVPRAATKTASTQGVTALRARNSEAPPFVHLGAHPHMLETWDRVPSQPGAEHRISVCIGLGGTTFVNGRATTRSHISTRCSHRRCRTLFRFPLAVVVLLLRSLSSSSPPTPYGVASEASTPDRCPSH